MADDKSLRDDVAALAEAVRELRDREVADAIRSLREEIAALRAERAAHSCGCWHVHYQPLPAPTTITYPQIVCAGTSTYQLSATN